MPGSHTSTEKAFTVMSENVFEVSELTIVGVSELSAPRIFFLCLETYFEKIVGIIGSCARFRRHGRIR